MKKNKGITLIALVVTIVVLIILAGITIGTLTGENGTIKKAQEAKREQEISQEREIVELSAVQAGDKDKFGNVEKENLNQALIENIGDGKYELKEDDTKFTVIFKESDSKTEHYIWKDLPILTNANMRFTYNPSTWTNQNVTVTIETTVGGYTIQTSTNGKDWTSTNKQIYNENGTIYARLINENNQYNRPISGNITNIDKTKPIITSVTATTNNIKITATDEASGIVGYTATTSNTAPTSFTKCTSTKSLNVKIENVKQNTTYYVWVKDQAGNISLSKTIKTEKVPDLTIANMSFSYTPTDWTNGNVTATANATVAGYTIETSTDNKAWTATNQQTRSINGPVYARLKDSTGQVGGVATGNVTNIDKNAPSAIITLGGAGTVEANPTIYATVNHTDGESGVYLGKYILTTNGAEIGTDENNYQETFASNGQQIAMALPSEGEYYIHVLTIDNAGNKKETISKKVNLLIKSHTHTDECYKTCPGTIVSRDEPHHFERDGRIVLGAGIKCNTCDFAGFTTSNIHSEDYVLNWYHNNLGRKCGRQTLICTKNENSTSYEISY